MQDRDGNTILVNKRFFPVMDSLSPFWTDHDLLGQNPTPPDVQETKQQTNGTVSANATTSPTKTK